MNRVECPICRADLSTFWGREYRGHRIVRCRGCGLRYVNPRRGEAENLEIYGRRYFDRARDRERGDVTRDLVRLRDTASIEAIRRHCTTESPSLLDVGAGTGSFAIRARNTEFFGSISATDISDANQKRFKAAGIDLYIGELPDLSIGPFDVITAQHVLEHVLDPAGFLEAVHRALVPSGLFHVLVPNEASFTSRVKSTLSRVGVKPRPFKHLAPGHHLYFFEPATLKRLLTTHGFRVEAQWTRADAKHRGWYQSTVHRAFDALGMNSWIELIARPV